MPFRIALSRAGAALIILLGALSLVSRQLGHAVGHIDALFLDAVRQYPYRPFGIMATNTALTFILTGAAILLVSTKDLRMRRAARWLGVLGAVLSGIALLGHLYGAPALYAMDVAAGMGLLTAMALAGLQVGILFLHPGDDGVSLVTGRDLAARLMRWLIPLTVMFPVLLSLLWIRGRELSWFSRETGVALFVVFTVAWITAMLLRSASFVRRVDRDRTELLERERASRSAAESANRAKGDFLAMMSHELRTPLNAIVGYVALLSDGVSGTVTTSQEQNLRRIRDNARHLTHVVDEVLTLARVEAGKESVQIEPVDVQTLVHDVSGMVLPLASAKGLLFSSECLDSISVQSDAHKLRQILVNLAGNAVKFTRAGSIALRGYRDGDQVVIAVSDTGVGIAPEHLDRVFDEFWQVERPHTRSQGGTGLGLAVSRKLARLLGGDIDVTSTPGVGSTFRLVLPAQRATTLDDSPAVSLTGLHDPTSRTSREHGILES